MSSKKEFSDFDKGFLNQKLKLLKLLWVVLLVEITVLIGLMYFVFKAHKLPEVYSENVIILEYITYLLTIAAIPFSYYLTSKKAEKSCNLNDNEEKVNIFFMTYLIKYAIFEITACFAVLAHYLSHKPAPLYMAGILLIFTAINKPSNFAFFKEFYTNEPDEDVVIIEEDDEE